MLIKHLLITGPPRCGKTTTIRHVTSEFKSLCVGFVTTEIIGEGKRVGFAARTFSGKEIVLAHVDLKSPHRVGQYRVDVESFEGMLADEFNDLNGKIVIIDEIGKMELLSERFRRLIEYLWETGQQVIATVLQRPHPFCDRIKSDSRTLLLDMSQSARQVILEQFRNIASHMAVSVGR